TDAAGGFAFSAIPIGTYTVSASKPPDWQAASVAGVVIARDAAAVLPGSPVAMAPIASASISGTALVEGGTAAGTTVTLSGQDFRGAPVSATTPTSATGTWS